MNRLKHIAEQGYKVKYIWITNFKRYTLDLEESEKNNTPKPNLFDYMNVNKHYILGKQDTHLLYKGSQRVFQRNNTCAPENMRFTTSYVFAGFMFVLS